MKLETIYEDDQIVAFNKPSGLLTIPHRFYRELLSLHKEAEKQYGKLFIVHRIDKDTSGAIIFAKNEVAHRHYSMAFQNRQVQKHYRALCVGNPVNEEGVIITGIMEHPTIKGKMVINRKGKEAHSEYKVLEKWPGYAYLEVAIYTGRTHQIRVHMQSLGTPIIADDIYGDGKPLMLSSFKKKFNDSGNYDEEKPLLNRMALHAYELIIPNLEEELIHITAPIPKDFKATINQLNKWS